MTTTVGFTRTTSATIRAAPPALVSPLMLALTSRQAGVRAASRWPVSATQPCSAAMPYAAESESPITSTVRSLGIAAALAGGVDAWVGAGYPIKKGTRNK